MPFVCGNLSTICNEVIKFDFIHGFPTYFEGMKLEGLVKIEWKSKPGK